MSKESSNHMKENAPVQTIQIMDPDAGEGRLKSLGGSSSDDFNTILVYQVLSALWLDHGKEAQKRQYDAAGAALVGIKPADEIEGMLAAQMVATHHAAMECFRRSMIRDQTFEGRREELNQANKLVRSYAMLLETLNRHRGKGQQKVTVEHVHVHSGGQAIVGAVQGDGAARESEEQPHAPSAITHEPGIPMRGADAERETVPVAGGEGQAPL